MEIKFEKVEWQKIKQEAVAIYSYKDKQPLESDVFLNFDKALHGEVSEMFRNKELTGKVNESVWISTLKKLSFSKLLIHGLGEKKEVSAEELRKFAASVISKAKSLRVKHLLLWIPPAPKGIATVDWVKALTEALWIGAYRFPKEKTRLGKKVENKSDDENQNVEVQTVTLASNEFSDRSEILEGIRLGNAVGRYVNEMRTLVYMPANLLTPHRLAQTAIRMSKSFSNLKVKVLDEIEMRRLGMNALLGVGQGSKQESHLIVLEYQGDPKSTQPPLALIGKGVTFDTGGISLKPAKGMKEMTGDMGGAACVLGSVLAAAELKLKKNILGVIPTVENMPDGEAQRPGDVVTAMNGKSIEVINTDAEGRLILCDAMVYAQKKYGVKQIIDFATLTGACIVALGRVHTGVMSNADDFVKSWIAASKRAGEKMWQLPLDAEYFDLLKSETADMMNCSEGGEAGTISAAKFLEQFVEKGTEWIHCDIAGTSDLNKKLGIYNQGPTGAGIRTVIEYLRG